MTKKRVKKKLRRPQNKFLKFIDGPGTLKILTCTPCKYFSGGEFESCLHPSLGKKFINPYKPLNETPDWCPYLENA